MKKELNRKKLLIAMFILLFSFYFASIGFASAQVNSCSPTIKLVNQDPNPAIPDDYVKVLFEVTNLGNCNGFAVKLNPQYPFSLDDNSSAVQTIESIPFAQDSKNSWMIPYKIRIDKDAFDGDYNLKLQFHEGANDYFQSTYSESDFNVSIKDSRIAFDAVIQEVSGTSVSIAVANIGKYAANSVIVRIPEQDSFVTTGTDGQMVGNLASGDYTLVGFTISPKTNFAGNFTRGQMPRNNSQIRNISTLSSDLKFDIYYTDNIGVRRIINMQLPLKIGNSSAALGAGMYSRSKVASTPWYSSFMNWVIIIIIIGILYFLYRKYKENGGLKNIFHHSPQSKKSSDSLPDWIKNSKEKEKKK